MSGYKYLGSPLKELQIAILLNFELERAVNLMEKETEDESDGGYRAFKLDSAQLSAFQVFS